jgi:iron complex transport system ATP-binding protein
MEYKNGFGVQALSFDYGGGPILRDLNFTIAKGRITTFMGANGSGKTTLFNLMTKNLRPQTGRILLNGEDIEAIRLRRFAGQVAIVHQTNTAPPDLTVRRLVEYGRTSHHRLGGGDAAADIEAVDNALDITGLSGLADKAVGALSGGQRQRVFIALSIAQQPQILFLDEPTTYLDVHYQLEILQLIRRLNEDCGLTIIMVLHDINQALHYSHELLALSPQGQLLAQGTPETVVTPELLEAAYGVPLKISAFEDKPFVVYWK